MNILKRSFTDLAAWLGRLGRTGKRKALIIPPATPGSTGDAAMIGASIHMLRQKGYEEVNLLQLAPGTSWKLDHKPDRLIPGARFIDYGSFTNLASLLLETGSYSDVFCIGADILDGIYDEDRMARRLELLARAARSGIRATVLGSSFSEHPSPRIVALIRSLPDQVRLFARDGDSCQRMLRALERPVSLSADVAFLLEPAEPDEGGRRHCEWMESQSAAGRRIIGVNANYLHEKTHPELVRDYARLVERLIDGGCSILMVPHDTRTERSDFVIAGEILSRLTGDRAGHARLLDPVTPGQLKTILGRLDLLVTGRMHAAIIALGAHTPAMSFAYANKFEGLYRHLGLEPEDMILSLARLGQDPGAVSGDILRILSSSSGLRTHIAGRIDGLRQAAALNFQETAPGAA